MGNEYMIIQREHGAVKVSDKEFLDLERQLAKEKARADELLELLEIEQNANNKLSGRCHELEVKLKSAYAFCNEIFKHIGISNEELKRIIEGKVSE